MRIPRILSFLVILTASVAWATTLADVQSAATTLDTAYHSLDQRVDACPRGACVDRSAILSDRLTLEGQRSTLHSDRTSLDPCSNCSTVDATISSIDTTAGTVAAKINEWDSTD